MRMRRVLAGFIGVTVVAGLLVLLIWHAGMVASPAVLNVVSIEPARIIDDAGAEMWLLTLSISNKSSDEIYVKETGWPIEVRVANRWIAVEGRLGGCDIYPGQPAAERLILVPAGTDSCRFRLKYAGSSPIFNGRGLKGRLGWLVEHFPLSVRRRIGRKFWGWVGNTSRGPSSYWRDFSVELLVPPRSTPPRVGRQQA